MERDPGFYLTATVDGITFDSKAWTVQEMTALEQDPKYQGRIFDLINVGYAFPGINLDSLVTAVANEIGSGQSPAAYLDRHSDQNNNQQIHTQNNPLATRFNKTYSLAHDAKYIVTLTYNWSLDSTSGDFQASFLVNGNEVRSHRQEPQDSGGAGGPTGTDQQHTATLRYELMATAGDNDFRLDFGPNQNGVEATIHSHLLTVERFV